MCVAREDEYNRNSIFNASVILSGMDNDEVNFNLG